jgi:hypothetical protein
MCSEPLAGALARRSGHLPSIAAGGARRWYLCLGTTRQAGGMARGRAGECCRRFPSVLLARTVRAALLPRDPAAMVHN